MKSQVSEKDKEINKLQLEMKEKEKLAEILKDDA